MKDHYHHGNLRQTLIDASIKIINESGEESLSLRKVAAACGVSHAAPYAHFQDKESLLEAVKQTVTNRFAQELEDAVNAPGIQSSEDAIMAMGKRYILFFRENPDYFCFLFHKQKIQVHVDISREYDDDYKPFIVFRSLFKKYLEEHNIDMPLMQQDMELMKTWAIVQGFASIACMSDVHVSIPWEIIAEAGIGGDTIFEESQ